VVHWPEQGSEVGAVLELNLADAETQWCISNGEIGGSAEEDAAQFLVE